MKVKEKLLEVTTDLIKERRGDPSSVTVREIAARANAGVGLVNYHFQSKENLIDLCVQRIINGVIAQSKPDMSGLSPLQRLKTSVKIPVDFIMDNPEISKISILGDLFNGKPGDNTFAALARYYRYASGLADNADAYFKAAFLLHGIQGIFLRRELYRNEFDFSDKARRDRLLDSLVERIFGENENE